MRNDLVDGKLLASLPREARDDGGPLSESSKPARSRGQTSGIACVLIKRTFSSQITEIFAENDPLCLHSQARSSCAHSQTGNSDQGLPGLPVLLVCQTPTATG